MVRKEVQLFSQDMEKKLKQNDHKKGWKDCTSSYLLLRAREEFAELVASVKEQKEPNEIIEEAADLANFCMMIADNARNGRINN